MTSLFLDANFVIALEVSDDQHHNEAIDHWKNLIETSFSPTKSIHSLICFPSS